MTVGEFKRRFSEALDAVREGKTIMVSYGRNRRNIAALVPCAALNAAQKRPLGLLKTKARVRFARDFALDDQQFMKS
jgi:antitoxin (DNA-binding transcriptional repressor) of toxin-antitoxin stability system